MKQFYTYIMLLVITITSCSTVKETSKQPIKTGLYKISGQKNKHYYTMVNDDSITLYPVAKSKSGWIADTAAGTAIAVNSVDPNFLQPIRFVNSSFDLDVMTIFFEYRPATAGFPRQLNTNFNAAGFLGYRTDLYILSYDKTPLQTYQTRINHFAYSLGAFMGLGATTMNPFVTNNNIQYEYNGVVLTNGLAALVGVGNFTFGTALGFDTLLDNNRKSWIYSGKPWVGFTVGFNIN